MVETRLRALRFEQCPLAFHNNAMGRGVQRVRIAIVTEGRPGLSVALGADEREATDAAPGDGVVAAREVEAR